MTKGTLTLPKFSFHPCLHAVVLMAVSGVGIAQVGEKRLSIHIWKKV